MLLRSPLTTHMLLRIATRKSPLALWQAEHVAARLRAAHPELRVELVPLSTRGDEVLDRSLDEIGGKGLFLKELEIALANDEADIAVHSLKDMPAALEPGFAIGAVMERGDVADAFVSNDFESLDELPRGAIWRSPICAAMSARACRNWTQAVTPRWCWLRRACSGSVYRSASVRGLRLRTGCPHRGRVRSRWKRARTMRASPNSFPHWTMPTRAAPPWPNARSMRPWAATARCRWAHGASSTAMSCICTDCWAMRAMAECCARTRAAKTR